jgi:hypothetical protein
MIKQKGGCGKLNLKKKPNRKDKIPATLRNAIWSTYISATESQGNCYCCVVEPITKANFAAGHIVAECRGGTVTLQNLRPICTLCNSSMGKTNMHEFIKKYGLAGGLRKYGLQRFTGNFYTTGQSINTVTGMSRTLLHNFYCKLKDCVTSIISVFRQKKNALQCQ